MRLDETSTPPVEGTPRVVDMLDQECLRVARKVADELPGPRDQETPLYAIVRDFGVSENQLYLMAEQAIQFATAWKLPARDLLWVIHRAMLTAQRER